MSEVTSRGIERRQIAKGVAWTAPAFAIGVAAPMAAASPVIPPACGASSGSTGPITTTWGSTNSQTPIYNNGVQANNQWKYNAPNTVPILGCPAGQACGTGDNNRTSVFPSSVTFTNSSSGAGACTIAAGTTVGYIQVRSTTFGLTANSLNVQASSTYTGANSGSTFAGGSVCGSYSDSTRFGSMIWITTSAALAPGQSLTVPLNYWLGVAPTPGSYNFNFPMYAGPVGTGSNQYGTPGACGPTVGGVGATATGFRSSFSAT